MASFVVVIEHLEPCINKWVLKEYEYAVKIYGSRLLITNVKNLNHLQLLSKFVHSIRRESIVELLVDTNNVIVLDPSAKNHLEVSELKTTEYVVLGGIMGSHPPKGRTWLYITSKLRHAKARNIGPYQYTIAGAIYILRKIEEGKSLSEIRFVHGLRFKKGFKEIEFEILLPYAFPVDDEGRVALPEDYIKVVAEHIPVYEQRVLRDRNNSICYDS